MIGKDERRRAASVDQAPAGTSVVLLYHRLGPPKLGSLVAGQYVAPRLFGSQLDYLSRRGWRGASLAELVGARRSDVPEPHDEFCVTFDDGYLSVYDHACPSLAQRGLTATIYVVAGAVGGINEWDRAAGDREERMMSAEQIKELCAAGFEIGSHTMTHPRLTEAPDDKLRAELVDSKHVLEDMIGKQVAAFSYPYGDYDGRVLEAVKAAGYTSAATTRLGVVVPTTTEFDIPRVNVRWNAVGPLLMRKINRARKASGLNK